MIVWVLIIGVLALRGMGVDKELTVHPVFIDGTSTKRAHEIALRKFGTEDALIVMLRGPQRQVERQGRNLAASLDEIPRSLVVSPWSRQTSVNGLRPSPEVAAILLKTERHEGESVEGTLPPVQRRIDETIATPVHTSIAGLPPIFESYRNASEQAATTGELIAVPVLLLVLLLVFRSVLAAAIPVLIGGAVVGATRGVMSLALGVVHIDAFALGAVGMMGLALGVDYSLLVVSRFREEQAQGRGDVAGAVQATIEAAGRSIIPAGAGLALALLATAQLIPGSLGVSVAVAVIAATLLSVLSALLVAPALLMLVGDNLDRWALPQRKSSQGAAFSWSQRLSSRPVVVVSIVFVLLFCAGWAFTLRSHVTSVHLLPSGDSGRVQQEEVERTLGPGWVAPIEVVMDGRGTPVTTPDRLDALVAFQHRVERYPGVETMSGFTAIEKQANQLSGVESGLQDQEHSLIRLDTSVTRVHDGAALSTRGMLGAAEGARQIDSGVGATHAGAGSLAKGLQATSTGSSQLAQGLGHASEGSGHLADSTSKASAGAGRLAHGLEKAKEQTGEVSGSALLIKNAMRAGNSRLDELHSPIQGTEQQLAAAWKALQQMTTGRSDPEYAAALRATEEASQRLSGIDPRTGEPADESYDGVEAGVERAKSQFDVGLYLASQVDKNGREASEGVTKLAKASTHLDHGLQRLSAGSHKMSEGIAELAHGGGKISPALRRLSQGAEHLVVGLGELETGTNGLAGSLGSGAEKSKLLTGALHRIDTGLKGQQGSGSEGSQLSQVQEQSPGLFHSGYFILAGLDGGHPEKRRQVNFLLNLDRGGLDARMMVIPRFNPLSDQSKETTERLQEDATDLAQQTGTEVVVGGLTPSQIDVNNAFRDQAPLIRLVLSLISMLVLIPVMRSLTMPFIAALLNLVTVSASFGVLSLLFNGSLLGGPGYVDAAVIPASMMVMFGLAIDYEVFIFARMREEYVQTGSPSAAVANGLRHTAPVVTGGALIMIAVFLAFSVSSFITVRNFGVAQAIGVTIDAFIVRLVVVPALMGVLGKWSWWMPRWLDRLLPGGAPVAAAADPAKTS